MGTSLQKCYQDVVQGLSPRCVIPNVHPPWLSPPLCLYHVVSCCIPIKHCSLFTKSLLPLPHPATNDHHQPRFGIAQYMAPRCHMARAAARAAPGLGHQLYRQLERGFCQPRHEWSHRLPQVTRLEDSTLPKSRWMTWDIIGMLDVNSDRYHSTGRFSA